MSPKDDKPRGIVDPWRTVEPLRPKPVAVRPKRINLDEIDLDADMAIPGRYTIRSTHASFDVTSIRIVEPRHALDVLADCVAELWRDKHLGVALQAAGIGVRTRLITYNAPDSNTAASSLKGDECMLWFIGKPLDKGLLSLVRILRANTAAPILKKHGVVAMITG